MLPVSFFYISAFLSASLSLIISLSSFVPQNPSPCYEYCFDLPFPTCFDRRVPLSLSLDLSSFTHVVLAIPKLVHLMTFFSYFMTFILFSTLHCISLPSHCTLAIQTENKMDLNFGERSHDLHVICIRLRTTMGKRNIHCSVYK
jgi:hypothetical protein